ncbi:MAG TPA: response regulator transcription factor [Actinomycetota bacterium]|nr:response regulator transcription factor [Actinomycetota bacterium]
MAATQILLVEDDARIRDIVERGLGTRGFNVTLAPDAASGIELATKLEVDLVLLDLNLPDSSGLDVMEEVRKVKPRLPFIVLTALDDTLSKVGGLDAGADDYVTKPFSLDELVARVRARLRWGDEETTVLQAGTVTLDLASHRAFIDGHEVQVSARELSLLAAFMRHPGQVLSRAQLLEMVWDLAFDPGSNVVDVHVSALRRKIGGELIETVRGSGYRFVSVDPTAVTEASE